MTISGVLKTTSNRGGSDEQAAKGYLSHHRTDIVLPTVKPCKPRLSKVIQITRGIMCNRGLKSCQFTHEVSLKQTYSTSHGIKSTMTVTAGVEVKIFSASLSLSLESSWEESFLDGTSTTDRYTFDLEPGTSCRPSMIHVELDCEVEKNTYWFDADVTWPYGLESHNSYWLGLRPTQSPEREQHCFADTMKTEEFAESSLSKDIFWKNACPWDPDRSDWGAAFIGSSSELTRFLAGSSVRPIKDSELVIRPSKYDLLGPGSGKEMFNVFRCEIAKPARDRSTMTVPLKGDNGILLGYIGCV